MNQWGMPPFIVNVMDSLNKIVSAGYAAGVSHDVENIPGRKPRSFSAFLADSVGARRQHAPTSLTHSAVMLAALITRSNILMSLRMMASNAAVP